ncbi:hypothetical protein Aph01nite_18710 [Acrocarpospora phusangensis]|uniref:Uncharacterized protein n=1 Tax=Acrocarpospora phusangensis TaxID=1070424 RepID=A0A919Q7E6_9ACTN|nr:hypothetical protein Aph01nite_18710 [Acrocarpospora phusangensis]
MNSDIEGVTLADWVAKAGRSEKYVRNFWRPQDGFPRPIGRRPTPHTIGPDPHSRRRTRCWGLPQKITRSARLSVNREYGATISSPCRVWWPRSSLIEQRVGALSALRRVIGLFPPGQIAACGNIVPQAGWRFRLETGGVEAQRQRPCNRGSDSAAVA